MVDEIYSRVLTESSPAPIVRNPESGHTVQKFRFVPESYLAVVGAEWDAGLEQLIYLRMFIEEETE